MKFRLLATSLCALACSALYAAPAASEVVFTDNFDQLPSGVLMGIVGAEAEYHYIRETAPVANWGTATYRSEVGWQRAWRGIEFDGKRVVKQFIKNTSAKFAECHPILACDADGAFLWKDCTINIRYMPHDTSVLSGVIVRYVTNRNNCRVQVVNGKAQIVLVNDGKAFRVPNEKILAETAFAYKADEYIDTTVILEGDNITATLKNAIGSVTLKAADATYKQGKIALVSDAPATYAGVKVSMTPAQKNAWLAAKKSKDDEELALQSANPKPVLWKKIDISGFGIGRNVRFGNLLGNGQKQIVVAQVRHLGPKDTNAEISCVTAIDLNGKKLWQVGSPDPWNSHLTNDVAIQVHDIDGDGKDEVIYTMNRELIIADGATGKVKRKCPTPERLGFDPAPNRKFKQNQWFPNILGDSIHFCDVRGTGRKADILIKDRYQAFWLYDENLNPLWHAMCNTGHYPYALDTDGDGKDEIFIGYSLYSHDGKQLWTYDEKYGDHDDGLAFVRLNPNDNYYSIFMAGSDEGVIVLDQYGKELKHHYLGHVQNPGVAKFDPNDPGLQAVTVNFWGNQGIIHFFNSKGDITHVMEPSHHGSVCLPVNWTGEPAEFVMLSPNYEDGGLFDYKGRRVMRIPCDGHPEMTYHAMDLTGDCRDEIVVWDENEIWIYTQSDNGKKPGNLYKPVRDYLMNDSNYRAYVSIPPDYPAKIEKKK